MSKVLFNCIEGGRFYQVINFWILQPKKVAYFFYLKCIVEKQKLILSQHKYFNLNLKIQHLPTQMKVVQASEL